MFILLLIMLSVLLLLAFPPTFCVSVTTNPVYHAVPPPPPSSRRRPQVYLLGNPIVVLVCGVFVLVAILSFLLALRYREHLGFAESAHSSVKALRGHVVFSHRRLLQAGFCAAAYLMNVLPYLAVTRCAFVYHYMPALMYGELLVALGIECLPEKYRNGAAVALIAVSAAAYAFFAPWVYTTPLTPDEVQARRWLEGWD